MQIATFFFFLNMTCFIPPVIFFTLVIAMYICLRSNFSYLFLSHPHVALSHCPFNCTYCIPSFSLHAQAFSLPSHLTL